MNNSLDQHRSEERKKSDENLKKKLVEKIIDWSNWVVLLGMGAVDGGGGGGAGAFSNGWGDD